MTLLRVNLFLIDWRMNSILDDRSEIHGPEIRLWYGLERQAIHGLKNRRREIHTRIIPLWS